MKADWIAPAAIFILVTVAMSFVWLISQGNL
jgi:hypothetical protein